jgi:hypothetical protein
MEQLARSSSEEFERMNKLMNLQLERLTHENELAKKEIANLHVCYSIPYHAILYHHTSHARHTMKFIYDNSSGCGNIAHVSSQGFGDCC